VHVKPNLCYFFLNLYNYKLVLVKNYILINQNYMRYYKNKFFRIQNLVKKYQYLINYIFINKLIVISVEILILEFYL